MAAVPIWLVGKDVTSVLVQPQNVDLTTGALTPASGVAPSPLNGLNIFGVLNEISLEETVSSERIEAITSARQNEVVLERGINIVMSEVMRYNDAIDGTPRFDNLLIQLWAMRWNTGQTIVSTTFIRGAMQYLCYGEIQSYRETVRKGKCIAQMSMRHIRRTDADNPVIT